VLPLRKAGAVQDRLKDPQDRQGTATRPNAAAGRPDERDFRRLWAGDAVSQLGSQVTLFALPFTAVAVLHTSGGQVGVLQALYTISFLLVPLPVGVWLEHRERRPVMIATNLLCAALVFSVPLAAAFGALRLPQLDIVALLGGAATVTGEIAKLSTVPHLVTEDRLASANSRLNAGIAIGATAGPGIAGWLTALVGAPNALVADGISYLFCAGTLSRVRRLGIAPATPDPTTAVAQQRNARAELKEGLHTVFGTPPVRAIAIHAAIYNAGIQLVVVSLIVYFVRDLGYGSGAYGVVLMVGGLGAVAGTLLAPLLIRATGHGPAMLVPLAFAANAFWVLPAIHASRAATIVWFSAAVMIGSAGAGTAAVVSSTIRQRITPKRLHARMNASFQIMQSGTIPIGAIAGGILVDAVGAHTTLWIGPAVLLLGVLPLTAPAVRSLGRLIGSADSAAVGAAADSEPSESAATHAI
jgi:predicted MFS family arabinose efflux permease